MGVGRVLLRGLMMYRYVVINSNGYVIGECFLSGKVTADNQILVSNGFDYKNKRYINGEWIEAEAPTPEPTEQDIFQAQTLLNQAEIITKQADMDETLAAILLNQMGV